MCYFRTAVLPYTQENRVIQIHQQQVKMICPTSEYSSISLSKTQFFPAIIMEKAISLPFKEKSPTMEHIQCLCFPSEPTAKQHHLKTAKSVLQFKSHSNALLLLLQTSKADFTCFSSAVYETFLPK